MRPVDGELKNHERGLVEAWEPRYAAMVEGLPPTSGPKEKVLAGQRLFSWVETMRSFLCERSRIGS